MSELEIKELQELQSTITYFENELRRLEQSRRYTFGINQQVNSKCYINFANGTVHVGEVPLLAQSVFELVDTCLKHHLETIRSDRNKLILCTKQEAKPVYKPIDILDKE